MAYQLVLATDAEIVVWHTDHGHIYLYNLDPDMRQLVLGWTKDIEEAPVRALDIEPDAKLFADGEARRRRLIG